MLRHDFLAGVVEGFYGRPWLQSQRLHLVGELASLGLNTYFYAPKNDPKHRSIWRELYDDTELEVFREVAQSCRKYGLNFFYGLSPGLDIRFADQSERGRIKARFEQLRNIGVQHFALLFDDLPGELIEDDRRAFKTLAAAQCDVTNSIFKWLQAQSPGARFLFCPTPYCDRMDCDEHGGAAYLDEVGGLLDPRVDVLWTGPEIVPQEIPVASIEQLKQRIGRRPVIWDNLFANDYDIRRAFCGPYSGRPRELRDAARGVLINPNTEYPLNFIPLRTFAAFLTGEGERKPREAFLSAAAEWLPSYKTLAGQLALDDLILLVDYFYLPHEEGPEANTLLSVIHQLLKQPVAEWGDAHDRFTALNVRIQGLFHRLTELCDRELFCAWSHRIWDLKEDMLVLEAALVEKKAGRDLAEGVEMGICLPGTFRGGILAKLERFLMMDGTGKIRTQPMAE